MGATRMVVQVADLRRACAILLDRVEDQFGTEIDLGSTDHYWEVDLTASFALADKPEEHLGCGQVSDELAEITALLTRPEDDVVLWHDLGHLAALLRCVAYLDRPVR